MLLVILLSVFIVEYVITRYELGTSERYTLFVDLVLIMLALAGVIGVIVLRLISHELGTQTRGVLRESLNFTRVENAIDFGLSSYEQYQILSALPPTSIDPMDHLNKAIEKTTKALKLTEKLEGKKYEEWICVCKNNLAYYLAERQKKGEGKPEDKELAESFAEYVRKRIDKYPRHSSDYEDTLIGLY